MDRARSVVVPDRHHARSRPDLSSAGIAEDHVEDFIGFNRAIAIDNDGEGLDRHTGGKRE